MWGKRPIEEKWKWLHDLGFYPAQGPVRTSTEEPGLGNLGHEAESIPGTEIEEGETEREVDLINREKEPKLTASEWNRLKTCERPRTKEEWGAMSTQTQWKTMGVSRFIMEEIRRWSKRGTRDSRAAKVRKGATAGFAAFDVPKR